MVLSFSSVRISVSAAEITKWKRDITLEAMQPTVSPNDKQTHLAGHSVG